MVIFILWNILSAPVLRPQVVSSFYITSFLTGLIFVFGPFFFGFLGFTRFFAWMVSWGVLVILNGLLDMYVLDAGAGGTESLGPITLLALPLFVIVGIADEIRYRIKSRKLRESRQQKIST